MTILMMFFFLTKLINNQNITIDYHYSASTPLCKILYHYTITSRQLQLHAIDINDQLASC